MKLNNIFWNEGTQNNIVLNTLILGKFICSFRNISRYPFGEQFCEFGFFIEGVDNKLTELHPEDIGYYGVPFVGQYDINGCNMKEKLLDGRKLKGIVVYIKLVLDKLRY